MFPAHFWSSYTPGLAQKEMRHLKAKADAPSLVDAQQNAARTKLSEVLHPPTTTLMHNTPY
jgi:hypothetical protein